MEQEKDATKKKKKKKRKFLRPKGIIGDENIVTQVKCNRIKVSREKNQITEKCTGIKMSPSQQ